VTHAREVTNLTFQVFEGRILEDMSLKETCQKLQCEISLLRDQKMVCHMLDAVVWSTLIKTLP
jgi:hypothetical protein